VVRYCLSSFVNLATSLEEEQKFLKTVFASQIQLKISTRYIPAGGPLQVKLYSYKAGTMRFTTEVGIKVRVRVRRFSIRLYVLPENILHSC